VTARGYDQSASSSSQRKTPRMKHLIRALLYQKLLVDNNKALTLREPGIHEKATSENLHSFWSSGFLSGTLRLNAPPPNNKALTLREPRERFFGNVPKVSGASGIRQL